MPLQKLQKLPPPQMTRSKPKILLLDLPETAADALKEKGFNVSSGSLGKPYVVEMGSNLLPLIGEGELPNYREQEIVVVDLSYGELAKGPVGDKHRPEKELDFWAKCDQGFIDPRPRVSFLVKDAFDRAHSRGGVFVVFADRRTNIQTCVAKVVYRELEIEEPFKPDVWHLLWELEDMQVKADHGYEMEVCANSPLARLVYEHLPGGEFFCTLEGGYRRDDKWSPLVTNKFGETVGLCRCRGEEGSVIVLPQLKEKNEFLVKLFSNVLPEIAPHLFPDLDKGMWTHRPEYELTRVRDLQEKQIEIMNKAHDEVADLKNQISIEIEKEGWIHDLLTATGDELVEAVKRALSELGLQKIVDVDEARDREGKTRREDLQVQDKSPWLIVDVKGIGNYPSDEDVLQAAKHAMILMKELNRTDIDGLSIINHQRHLPPLDRENSMPFRQELIDAATVQHLGLLTTWDLYRLIINARKLGWSSGNCIPILYDKGRIEVIPRHYQFIGKVEKVWTDKIGVVIKQNQLEIGDRVAVEFPIEFEECDVKSIVVNDSSVEIARVGDPTGLLWPGASSVREGMRLFRISKNEAG